MSLPSMSSQRAWWHLFSHEKLENSAILLALAMKDESMEVMKTLKKVIYGHMGMVTGGALLSRRATGQLRHLLQGFEGPALVRRRNSLWLWPLKME